MSKEAKSTVEKLELLNEAISEILVAGQSYKIGSRQMTRADLKQLRLYRQELMSELTAENSTGMLANASVAEFEGRR